MAANNRHPLLSKRIISSRYKRVTSGATAPSALDSLATVGKEGDLKLDPAMALISARPLVVLGDVGVGKTSFFENLFEQLDASKKFNTYFIHIDLGIKANLPNDLKGYILSEIPLLLKTKYSVNIDTYDFARSIYYAELDDFDKSVKGSLKNIDKLAYDKERVAFLTEKVNQKDRHARCSRTPRTWSSKANHSSS